MIAFLWYWGPFVLALAGIGFIAIGPAWQRRVGIALLWVMAAVFVSAAAYLGTGM